MEFHRVTVGVPIHHAHAALPVAVEREKKHNGAFGAASPYVAFSNGNTNSQKTRLEKNSFVFRFFSNNENNLFFKSQPCLVLFQLMSSLEELGCDSAEVPAQSCVGGFCWLFAAGWRQSTRRP